MDTTFKATGESITRAASEPPLADPFSLRLTTMLGDAFLGILFSIGHRTGLFDVMSTLPPSSSETIAKAANLDERYVREWLGAMASRSVVEYDTIRHHFHLPASHADRLTRAAGTGNLAFLAQYVALASEHESKLVECFRRGGGVARDEFPDLSRLRAESSQHFIEAHLLSTLLPLVPWLGAKLERGITVADVGCRRGHTVEALAEAFPNSRFVGFDDDPHSLAIARERIERRGLTNIELIEHDLSSPIPGRYDFVTALDVVHELPSPGRTLSNVHEAIRTESPFLMVDLAASSRLASNLTNPLAPLLYSFSVLHSLPVSLAAGGPGLGAAWGEERAEGLLEEAGFREVEVHHVPSDPMHVVFIAWKR